ncbi:MAG: thiamine-monophosphate kinase [Bacteroidia bacterium]|jgi:thiamine-monophosphate kinase
MFENVEKTKIEELGEFGLIDHLASFVKLQNKNTKIGIGDDAAVIESNGTMVVVSTDSLVENVHFDIMYTPLKHLGYKAVVANLSDICAMNAIPSHITMAISFSSKYTLEAIEELYSGMLMACDKYEIDLIGGDTTTIPTGLVLTGTAIGFSEEANIVKRSGAKVGDILCVSGDLGGAYMGLQLLEREKRVFLENPQMQPDLKNHDYIVGRQLKPEARVDIIKVLKELNIIPTAMIDISDGLASEVFHLSKHSNVAFAIHEEKLPIDQDTFDMAVKFGIDTLTASLNGGEDYELLFTIAQADYEKLKNNPDITAIGYARELSLKNQLISKQDNAYDLKAQGWQHFEK